jgi:hypothetical protein
MLVVAATAVVLMMVIMTVVAAAPAAARILQEAAGAVIGLWQICTAESLFRPFEPPCARSAADILGSLSSDTAPQKQEKRHT